MLVEVAARYNNGIPTDQFCVGRWFKSGKPEVLVVTEADLKSLAENSNRISVRVLDAGESRRHASEALAKSQAEVGALTALLECARKRLEAAKAIEAEISKTVQNPQRKNSKAA